MASHIHVITSAPIEQTLPGYDVYDSFDLVSRGKRVAPLLPKAADIVRAFTFGFPIEKVTVIFAAPTGQTLATAQLLVGIGRAPLARVVPLAELEGVRFSMKSLLSKEEFNALPLDQALALARREFVTKFYHNQLLESVVSVRNRMAQLLEVVSRVRGEVLCIGHSFFLKLLEISISQPLAWDNLDTLLAAFQPSKKPYEFLTGFDL